MTAQTKSQLRVLFWTVLAGLVLLTAPKVADQVILRPEFEQHEAKIESKLDRVLDVVCADKPELRQCQ